MMPRQERETAEGGSYVDVLLRTYLRAIAEGGANPCDHMDIVGAAWRLMIRTRADVARGRELLKQAVHELSLPGRAPLLDAYPPDLWLGIALQACINEKMQICKGPDAKYFAFCVHEQYRDVVLSDPRRRIEPWCCQRIAEVVLQLADERGYGRLAVAER